MTDVLLAHPSVPTITTRPTSSSILPHTYTRKQFEHSCIAAVWQSPLLPHPLPRDLPSSLPSQGQSDGPLWHSAASLFPARSAAAGRVSCTSHFWPVEDDMPWVLRARQECVLRTSCLYLLALINRHKAKLHVL